MPDEFTHVVHEKEHRIRDVDHEFIHEHLTRTFQAVLKLTVAYKFGGITRSEHEHEFLANMACLICGKPARDILDTGLLP